MNRLDFDDRLIVSVTFQAKMSNISWFQFLKDLMLVFVLYEESLGLKTSLRVLGNCDLTARLIDNENNSYLQPSDD